MVTKNISFQTNQGGKLKTAIEALSLANSKGSGIIDIDPTNGFKISSIPDSNSGLNALMCLKPNELENFQCSQPLMNKMVNLKFLLRMLQAIEEDGIKFYQEDGTSMLSFEPVTYPGIALGVGLQENNVGFNAYSGTMSRTCEAIIPTEALNTMIPEMITNGFTQLVTVDITSSEMKFLIGKTEWEFKCNMEIGENAGLASGERRHVEFLWSHVDSLTKASSLAEQCFFGLLPSNDIMLQFRFEEGSVVYIKSPLVHTVQ